MHFLSKATLFAYMIVFLPSLLTNVLVWDKLFILDSILLAYLLRPRCQTLLYLHFITEAVYSSLGDKGTHSLLCGVCGKVPGL